MIARPQHPSAILFLLLPLLLFWSAGRAQAADIQVNANCTLHDAFATANDDTPVGSCTYTDIDGTTNNADTIVLTGSGQSYSHNFLINITSGSVITVQGNGNTISGNNSHRIFEVRGNLTLDNLTLSGGYSSVGGGAIYLGAGATLAIQNSTVTDNRALPSEDDISRGGVIVGVSEGDYSVTIRDSLFTSNRSAHGGDIMNLESLSGTKSVTIENSAFINNGTPGDPKWLINIVGYDAQFTVTISNSTFSGNNSVGISLANTVSATLSHLTVVGNVSRGLYVHHPDGHNAAPIVRLRNSLLAGNPEGDCAGEQFITENVGNLIQDGSCNPALSGDPLLDTATTGTPPYHELLAGSPALEAAACLTDVTSDQRNAPRPQPAGTLCDIGAYESALRAPQPPPRRRTDSGSDNDDGNGRGGASPTVTPTQTARLQAHSGEWLTRQGYGLAASHGLRSGVQFQRLGAAGVGIDWVIDLGFLDALDVWGFVEQGVEVCFPPDRGYGGLMFLDAATSPRAVSALASVLREGYTCASINRPGTLVLVSNAPLPSQLPMPTALPTTILRGCLVRTNYMLNFRDAPAGALLGQTIPFDVTLVALSRTAGWFQVDYHGLRGWISAGHVTPMGNCVV